MDKEVQYIRSFPTPSKEYAIYQIYLNGYPLFYFYDKRQDNYKQAITEWFQYHQASLHKAIKSMALRKHNITIDELSLSKEIFRMSIVNGIANHFGDRVDVACYHIYLNTKNNDNNSRFIPFIALKDISAYFNKNHLLFKF